MGVCKEKRKRKRAVKALEKACELISLTHECPYCTYDFEESIAMLLGCNDCEYSEDKEEKCWKKYFYLEVENGTQNKTEEARPHDKSTGY